MQMRVAEVYYIQITRECVRLYVRRVRFPFTGMALCAARVNMPR